MRSVYKHWGSSLHDRSLPVEFLSVPVKNHWPVLDRYAWEREPWKHKEIINNTMVRNDNGTGAVELELVHSLVLRLRKRVVETPSLLPDYFDFDFRWCGFILIVSNPHHLKIHLSPNSTPTYYFVSLNNNNWLTKTKPPFKIALISTTIPLVTGNGKKNRRTGMKEGHNDNQIRQDLHTSSPRFGHVTTKYYPSSRATNWCQSSS